MFLNDTNGLADKDNTTGGSPKFVSAPGDGGGTWSVGIKVKEGATDYRVLVNPVDATPAPRAEFEFGAQGSEAVDSFQIFKFPVVAGEEVNVGLE